MRFFYLSLFCLLLTLFGARSKPAGWGEGEGSSSGYHGSGFDWQDHPQMQAWTPAPSSPPDEWSALTPHQDFVGQQRQPGSNTPADSRLAQWTRNKEVIDLDSPVRLDSPLPSHPLTHAVDQAGDTVFAAQQPASGMLWNQASDGRPPNLEEWKANLRRALGNDRLTFTPVVEQAGVQSKQSHRTKYVKPVVYIASNLKDSRDWNPSTIVKNDPPPPQSSKRYTHFISAIRGGISIRTHDILFKGISGRVLVYLDSRFNMNYINEKYFNGKMQFLPINLRNLNWHLLDSMFAERQRLLMLPPIEKFGLPLLIARHNPKSSRLPLIEGLTGPLGNKEHVVSVWSPVLVDKDGPTAVLYGIGRLDMSDHVNTLEHLNEVIAKWKKMNPGVSYAAEYYLQDHWPQGYHV